MVIVKWAEDEHLLCAVFITSNSITTIDVLFLRQFKTTFYQPNWHFIEKFVRIVATSEINRLAATRTIFLDAVWQWMHVYRNCIRNFGTIKQPNTLWNYIWYHSQHDMWELFNHFEVDFKRGVQFSISGYSRLWITCDRINFTPEIFSKTTILPQSPDANCPDWRYNLHGRRQHQY